MKLLVLVIGIGFCGSACAQPDSAYVAAKPFLSIREKPAVGAKVIDKIPYGTRILPQELSETVPGIRVEGMLGYWKKVMYNNHTGYIIDAYLLPVPPPTPDIKDMKSYLTTFTRPFGEMLVTKSKPGPEEDSPGWELHKQLYSNGAERHEFIGYEYGSNTYFLPELTMQQAFLILRSIPEFEQVLTSKSEFPLQNKKLKKGDITYDIKVDKEIFSTEPWVKHITIEFEEGAIYSFELYQLNNQIVIFYGAGV